MKKTKLANAAALLALTIAAQSQVPGPSYTVSISWDKYADAALAAGFRILVAPNPGTYGGPGSQTYIVTNVLATNFIFSVPAGANYKAAMTAFTPYGLHSAPSPDVTWTAPASIPSPTGLRPTAIVFIP